MVESEEEERVRPELTDVWLRNYNIKLWSLEGHMLMPRAECVQDECELSVGLSATI